MLKFIGIFRFDFGYQLSRITTWIYFGLLLAFSVLTGYSLLDNVQNGEYFLNSPITIFTITAVSSSFALLLTSAVSANSSSRDFKTRIEPLIYTTSLKKLSYLSGRFMAAFSICLLSIIAVILILLISSLIPGMSHLFIPFQITAYIYTFFLFALPNAIISTGILFSLGILSRNGMTCYLGAALLFFLALISMDIISGELGLWELGKMLDPSGLTFLREYTLVKAPADLQYGGVHFDFSFLTNRLLWMSISLAFMTLSFFRFSFTHHTSGSRFSFKKTEKKVENGIDKWSNPISVLKDKRNFNLKTRMEQAAYLSIQSFREMFQSKVFLLVIATSVILIALSEEVLEGQLGVPLLPTTWRVIQFFNFMAVPMIMAGLITFYAGEIVWKERDTRISDMIDTAPVPNWLLFLSKFAGLFLLIVTVQLLFLITGLTIQFVQGHFDFNLSLYLKTLLGLILMDHILFAILAVGIHVLINQKYIGHLIVFIAYFYIKFPSEIGIEHKLLIFGSDPGFSYSDFSGFEPFIGPWLWFKFYWTGWGFLIALGIILFWNRGKPMKISKRWQQAKSGFYGAPARLAMVFMICIFLLGGFIFFNTNILNKYTSSKDRNIKSVKYEKKYGQYKGTAQPLLSRVKLWAEIYPHSREVDILGSYTLINKHSSYIDTIHISTSSRVQTSEITFSRKNEELVLDDDIGYKIYRLENPLRPGDSLSLEFKVTASQNGFSNNGIPRAVVSNGTYLGYHNMPAIGYKAGRESVDREMRTKHGLSPEPSRISVYDAEAGMDMEGEGMITFEAVIGTSPEQTAITTGTLDSTWFDKNRKYFRYKTDAPIRHNYEIFSADYHVYKDRWKDVKIEIFHHPLQTDNLERMVHGVKRSLEYYSESFTPYPHRQIRMVEYPGTVVGLNGNPVTMSYSEGFSFYAPGKDNRELDFPFAVVAHEVAHQWWGNELRPANVEGAPVLTESLAWYSAMMVVEKTYGAEHLNRLMRVMRREYLTPRSSADVPLLRTTDKFNAYRKGPFAMYAIKEYVGANAVNHALRSLIKKFRTGFPPLPVSLDLYHELQIVTPDSLQYLLKDLFEQNTYWELKAEKAKVVPNGRNEWEVMFDIIIKKVVIDEKGLETEVPMDDYIEVGIYADSPKGELGEELHLQKHRISGGKQTIKITTSKLPDVAGIDPNRLLIDRHPNDNFIEIVR